MGVDAKWGRSAICPEVPVLSPFVPICPSFGGRHDWTTGVPDNGNDWRKFRAVPRSYPLRSLFCTLFNRGGNKERFRLPGAGGGSFPLYGGTFARSYSVSILGARNGDKSGQTGTKRDISGQIAERPHLASTPPIPFPVLLFLGFWISLVNVKRGISLVILVFSLSFPRILWVRQGQKILGNFEVFLDKNQKTKEKKDRA